MKKALLAIAAAVGMVAAMPAAQAETGFGCYGSVIGGLANMDSNTTLTSPLIPTASLGIDNLGLHGRTLGLGIGCDARIDKFVAGALFDYDWVMGDAKNTINLSAGPIGIGTAFALKNTWFIGGRFGYEIAPKTLAYGLIGRTTANTEGITISSNLAPLNGGGTIGDLSGWTLGGGLETALANTNFTLKLEYRYTQLDTKDVPLGIAALPNFANANMQNDLHAVRLGLSYYFGPRAVENTASLK